MSLWRYCGSKARCLQWIITSALGCKERGDGPSHGPGTSLSIRSRTWQRGQKTEGDKSAGLVNFRRARGVGVEIDFVESNNNRSLKTWHYRFKCVPNGMEEGRKESLQSLLPWFISKHTILPLLLCASRHTRSSRGQYGRSIHPHFIALGDGKVF